MMVSNGHEKRDTLAIPEKTAKLCLAREEAIDALVSEAAEVGDCDDRLYWTLRHDFEHATITTNMAQLKDLGVTFPNKDDISDEDLGPKLEDIFRGLEMLSIFLIHTNHLSDRSLYVLLTETILVESVRNLPPGSGVSEFIDLIEGSGSQNRKWPSSRDARLPKPASKDVKVICVS